MRKMDSLEGVIRESLSSYAHVVDDISKGEASRMCAVLKVQVCPEDKLTIDFGLDHPDLLEQWFTVQRQIIAVHRKIVDVFGPRHIRIYSSRLSRSKTMRNDTLHPCLKHSAEISGRMARIERAECDATKQPGILEMLQHMWSSDDEDEQGDASSFFSLMHGDIRFPATYLMEEGEEGMERIEGLEPLNFTDRLQIAESQARESGLEGEGLEETMQQFRVRFNAECMRHAAKTVSDSLLDEEAGIMPMPRWDVRSGFATQWEQDAPRGLLIEDAFKENGNALNLHTIVFEPNSLQPLIENSRRIFSQHRGDAAE